MLGIALAVLALLWVGVRGGLEPYDDALFFLRTADHALQHGTFAWNLEDGPVHGNTSQLYQVVMTAIVALAPEHAIGTSRLLLAGCLVGAGLLSLRGCRPEVVVLALLMVEVHLYYLM